MLNWFNTEDGNHTHTLTEICICGNKSWEIDLNHSKGCIFTDNTFPLAAACVTSLAILLRPFIPGPKAVRLLQPNALQPLISFDYLDK